MNLRLMKYEKPTKNWDIYFNGKYYKVKESIFGCKICDAHQNRIPRAGSVNGGICPDSDRAIDYHCVCNPTPDSILKEVTPNELAQPTTLDKEKARRSRRSRVCK